MSDPRNPARLPDGVINADPAGGWQTAEAADAANHESAPDPDDGEATSSGLPRNVPEGGDATADAPAQPAAPAGPIEGDAAGRGADPDMVQDADLEQGRGPDPALDPGARSRQEGL